MKKIVCKECGKELSSKASVCPNCGVKIHPIKDILKMIVLVLGVLIGLSLLGAIIVNGMEFISKKQQEKENSKLIGTYELQTDNNTIDLDGYKMIFDKTMNITSVNNCGPEDKNCVIYFEDKLIRIGIPRYDSIGWAGNITMCFEFDNDTLKLTPCPYEDDIFSQEMNITYKKIK